ncbi:MAG: hypothetical protein ABW195_05050 [Ilumatobacteraceae bacterium]
MASGTETLRSRTKVPTTRAASAPSAVAVLPTPPGNVAAAITAPLDAAASVIGSAAGKIRDAAR